MLRTDMMARKGGGGKEGGSQSGRRRFWDGLKAQTQRTHRNIPRPACPNPPLGRTWAGTGEGEESRDLGGEHTQVLGLELAVERSLKWNPRRSSGAEGAWLHVERPALTLSSGVGTHYSPVADGIF